MFNIETVVAMWDEGEVTLTPGLIIGTGLADSDTWFVLTGVGDERQTRYIEEQDMTPLGPGKFLYMRRDPAEYLNEDPALKAAFEELLRPAPTAA